MVGPRGEGACVRGGIAVRYGPTNKRGPVAAGELQTEGLFLDLGE